MTATAEIPLRIGGVPEHFNFPWLMTLGVVPGGGTATTLSAEWCEYPTGTGAMLADLTQGRLDIAVVLTEGAAFGLARGMELVPVSLYTTSPLLWGIHVPPAAGLDGVDALEGARFAISRTGSGSHLMSLALAMDRGWDPDRLSYVVIDDLPGAVKAFADGRADAFLWEHFTTQPAVDSGAMRRIGDFPSPWPAWVICASSSAWQHNRSAIEALMGAVMESAQALKQAPDAVARIAAHYGLQRSAVDEWLGLTEWTAGVQSPAAALAAAREVLEAAGAV